MENLIVGICILIVAAFVLMVAISFYGLIKENEKFKARWKKVEDADDSIAETALIREYNLVPNPNQTARDAYKEKAEKEINETLYACRIWSMIAFIVAVIIKGSGWVILGGIIIAFPLHVVLMFLGALIGKIIYRLTKKKNKDFERVN